MSSLQHLKKKKKKKKTLLPFPQTTKKKVKDTRKRKKNSHFTISGGCWKKFICSSLPARLMDEFPASKVHLPPIGHWVWSKGEIHSFQAERGGGGTSEK